MTDADIIRTEVLEIVTGQDGGYTAQEVFEQSRIAMSLQEVTGALNRLRNAGLLVRSTDKRWRALNQPERQREKRAEQVKAAAKAVAAERSKPDLQKPADPKPSKPVMSKNDAIDSVRKVAQANGAGRTQCEPVKAGEAVDGWARPQKPRSLAWLVSELESHATTAQVQLDRYIQESGDELLAHLVEVVISTNNALEAARRAEQ